MHIFSKVQKPAQGSYTFLLAVVLFTWLNTTCVHNEKIKNNGALTRSTVHKQPDNFASNVISRDQSTSEPVFNLLSCLFFMAHN